jgi:hypothetical protein
MEENGHLDSPINGQCPFNSNPGSTGSSSQTAEVKTEELDEKGDDLNDDLSDIEELIENAIEIDVSKYPPGASVR